MLSEETNPYAYAERDAIIIKRPKLQVQVQVQRLRHSYDHANLIASVGAVNVLLDHHLTYEENFPV